MDALNSPYTMAAHAYFAELGLPLDRRYEVFSSDVNKAWDFNRRAAGGETSKGNSYTTTGDDLARALRRNPHLRVLVASGYYDLGTPYSATDWSLAQLDATADVLARVRHSYYGAGHMMYTRDADLKKLKGDLQHWLAGGD
jgi:carboxypeptidase C (cathepsin A)